MSREIQVGSGNAHYSYHQIYIETLIIISEESEEIKKCDKKNFITFISISFALRFMAERTVNQHLRLKAEDRLNCMLKITFEREKTNKNKFQYQK